MPDTSPLELAVVVPTLNEADNVDALLRALRSVLADISYEIIVVDDDSTDGTAERVREIAQFDFRIRCIQRIGRRGLSSAFLEGALATAAPAIAVIDGDMQHDERLLPDMLHALRTRGLEVVVGSRYLESAGLPGCWTANRARISEFATKVARRFTGITLSDPMSGFFIIRADVLRRLAPNLSATGFKILFDLFLTSPRPLRFAELPYGFRPRSIGTSKLDAKVMIQFVELLLDKAVGHLVPARFVIFAMVGSLGVVVHLTTLAILFKAMSCTFEASQAGATLIAMSSNFALNNIFTYYDRRLSGWRWLRGWLTFAVISSIGIFANVGVASYLFAAQHTSWLLSAMAGVLVGVVWNYFVTSIFTWRQRPV